MKLEITVRDKNGKIKAKRGHRRRVTEDGAVLEEISPKTKRWKGRTIKKAKSRGTTMQRRTFNEFLKDHIRHYLVKQAGVIPYSYNVKLTAKHADGEVFATRDISNMIMDAGEDEAAKLLVGVAADAFDWIALGITNTAPDDGQTTMASEITTNGGARAQDAATSVTANVATVDKAFSFTGALAIVEVGLFNATAGGGDMFARQIFDVINVGNGDSLTATWSITCGVAR